MFESINDVIEQIEGMSSDFYVGTAEQDAADIVVKILEIVDAYVKKHGNIALSCGGEFVYQSDSAQADAIDSFTEILESVAEYVDSDEAED